MICRLLLTMDKTHTTRQAGTILTMFLVTCIFLMSSPSMASAQTTCSSTQYGANCSNTCPTNCEDSGGNGVRVCDSSSGACLQGCKDGYKSSLCETACPPGNYGKECKMNCSQHCSRSDSKICDIVNGNCYGGCLEGYTGSLCNTLCSNTTYGRNCNQTCSKKCLPPGTCNSATGDCLAGCADGFMPSVCDKPCPPGNYGKDCKMNCSQHCSRSDSKICDFVNGNCYGGCLEGYMGTHCDTPCSPGTFGKECKSTCSTNCKQHNNGVPLCDFVNGSCTGGCIDGYTPPQCNVFCPSNTYGAGCSLNCSMFCAPPYQQTESPCNYATGICQFGCKTGYEGPKCTEECKHGYYGSECKNSCSEFCANSTTTGGRACNHISGNCLQGCVTGHEGQTCRSLCRFGTYGKNCSTPCNAICVSISNATESPCHPITGDCVRGCITGYSGPICASESEDPDKSVKTGLIVGLCMAIVAFIAALAVMFFYRRREKTSSNAKIHYEVPDPPSNDDNPYLQPMSDSPRRTTQPNTDDQYEPVQTVHRPAMSHQDETYENTEPKKKEPIYHNLK